VENVECGAWDAGNGASGVRGRWVRHGVAMTASHANSLAESASSTVHLDAQATQASRATATMLTYLIVFSKLCLLQLLQIVFKVWLNTLEMHSAACRVR
jgi:hypothetical protein